MTEQEKQKIGELINSIKVSGKQSVVADQKGNSKEATRWFVRQLEAEKELWETFSIPNTAIINKGAKAFLELCNDMGCK